MRYPIILIIVSALGGAACDRSSGATSAIDSGIGASTTASATTTATTVSTAARAPKAISRINGQSLSDAGDADVKAALTKAGWSYGGGSSMTMGAVTTISVTGTKGGQTAKVTLVRPSGKADDPNNGIRARGPVEAEKDYSAKGATKLDGDSLLAVVIEGKQDDAKALLAALLDK